MLRPARPLPSRFKRPVNPSTRRLVERRHARQKEYRKQRWQRSVQRVRRKFSSMKGMIVRLSIVGVVLLGALCIGIALFSPLLHVRQIVVRRIETRLDVAQAQRALAPIFGEHLLFIAPKQVETLLHERMPDVRSVEIAKQYPSTMEVRVGLQPIAARLEIIDPDADSASGALLGASGSALPAGEDFVTENGLYVRYPSSQVPQGSGMLLLQLVDWGVRPVPGTPLLDIAMLGAMQAAEHDILAGFGQKVERRVVYVRGREFHLKLQDGYTLWLDMQSDVQTQLSRYRTLLQAVNPDDIREYVDLRLTEKIVYK